MAYQDGRTRAGVDKGRAAGKRNVVYVDAKGCTRNAIVLGQGTSSGLKLRLTSHENKVVDNVPAMTNFTTTGCYRLHKTSS